MVQKERKALPSFTFSCHLWRQLGEKRMPGSNARKFGARVHCKALSSPVPSKSGCSSLHLYWKVKLNLYLWRKWWRTFSHSFLAIIKTLLMNKIFSSFVPIWETTNKTTELSMQLCPQKPYSFEYQKSPERNHDSHLLSISSSTEIKLPGGSGTGSSTELTQPASTPWCAILGRRYQLVGANQHRLCTSIPNPGIPRSQMMWKFTVSSDTHN